MIQAKYPGIFQDSEEQTVKFMLQVLFSHETFGSAASAMISVGIPSKVQLMKESLENLALINSEIDSNSRRKGIPVPKGPPYDRITDKLFERICKIVDLRVSRRETTDQRNRGRGRGRGRGGGHTSGYGVRA